MLKEGRKGKRSDLTTPMKVRAAARAMAAETMAAQVDVDSAIRLLSVNYFAISELFLSTNSSQIFHHTSHCY